MPRPRRFDTASVDALMRRQGGVATHQQLMALGVPRSTVIRWAQYGPWSRLLPAVVLAHRGTPDTEERRRAALAFCGPNAVISGTHALDLHGILGQRIDLDPDVLVLVPHVEHRTSKDFVVVERTTRMPSRRRRAGLDVAPVARAVADAARQAADDIDRVRELFGAALQRGRCTLVELREEVYAGPRQRTAVPRAVLKEASVGTASAAEGNALQIISRSDLPQPLWNEDVVVDGKWVGQADAYWPDLGVALEIDGLKWHSTLADIRRTQEKQRRYAAAGIVLITIAPADLLADPDGFLDVVRRTLTRAARRAAG
ncbi:hypothetical protein [Kineococcus sp. SYSU DK003]|uniref:hypothetical protein n=1 Tax=Kineococcus sp. SYSU DK003 TaxID=3383124 RepID=UPI003D7CF167